MVKKFLPEIKENKVPETDKTKIKILAD